VDQLTHTLLLGIENGLYQYLEGGILGLQAVDVFLVDAFASVVGMRSIFALG
jgi:hypothetical protein